MRIGDPLTLGALRTAYEQAPHLEFSLEAFARIDRGAKAIADVIASGASVYGVNTGFGLLANTEIA
ncbi:MAG: aromatic amino acid lyase, partial [Rhizomicrobium sp.]|nr:aromatic amino acid lyase [Rhizomicrobium sp.]